jgi:uncharacterized Zn-finger protein
MTKEEYECSNCNKTYSSKSNLNRHIKRCELNITYPCEYCNLILSDKESLKRHILICKKYEYIQIFKEEKKVFNDKIKNYEEEINKLKLELTILKEHNL